jgi:hypothetical protein
MPEINCKICGNIAQPEDRFCRTCGSSLVSQIGQDGGHGADLEEDAQVCGFCHSKAQWGDLSRQYVLTKGTSEYHGTYSIYRTKEIARVCVFICQNCYTLKMEAANPAATNKRGFLASLSGLLRITREELDAQLFMSLARENFSKIYPKEAAEAVDPKSTTFGPIRYNLETAESWEAKLRANR